MASILLNVFARRVSRVVGVRGQFRAMGAIVQKSLHVLSSRASMVAVASRPETITSASVLLDTMVRIAGGG